MYTISVSEFRKKLAFYLYNLPVTILDKKRNSPIAIVVPFEGAKRDGGKKTIAPTPPFKTGEVYLSAEEKKIEERDFVSEGVSSPTTKLAVSPEVWGWCQTHFEKKDYPLKEVSLEDMNGEIVWTKKACPKCLDRLRKQTAREGGRLIE